MKYTLTTNQVAALLNLSRYRVVQLARAGRLDAVKLARDWRFSAAGVKAYEPRPEGWPKGRPRKE